ncbi:hypothetical protein MNBD_GAMMA17-1488 [hydrothermal vent metagenome]|uniref:DUF4381 domain-containing protein n=1 Tax=hydrothermal vent metagenome TaxID=652676 RepID=A0A3B0ZQW1_9ZZZZ
MIAESNTIAPPVNHALMLARLADVQLPSEPALWPAFIGVVLVIIGAVLAIIIFIYLSYRRRQQSPATQPDSNAQQALERLTTIETAWSNGEIDARETAYRLSTLLRLGLNLPQLNHHCPPSLAHNKQTWQQTLTLFNQLRYQSHTTTQPLSRDTFEQLRLWLSASQHASANKSDKSGEADV